MTREKLLDAALEVFWEEGVARPSLTKVAERAGMTRGAIYGHFKNKGDVVSALCDRILFPSEALEKLREKGGETPLQTLSDWFVNVLRRTMSDPQHRKLMDILFLKCEAVEGDEVWNRLRYDGSRIRQHDRELLRRAVELGQLPADLDVDFATLAISSFITGLFRFMAVHPEWSLEDHIERIAHVALDMLDSPAMRLPS